MPLGKVGARAAWGRALHRPQHLLPLLLALLGRVCPNNPTVLETGALGSSSVPSAVALSVGPRIYKNIPSSPWRTCPAWPYQPRRVVPKALRFQFFLSG